MAMTVGDLHTFLMDFDDECFVYIGDDGLTLQVEDEKGTNLGYYEVGGQSQEEENYEQEDNDSLDEVPRPAVW